MHARARCCIVGSSPRQPGSAVHQPVATKRPVCHRRRSSPCTGSSSSSRSSLSPSLACSRRASGRDVAAQDPSTRRHAGHPVVGDLVVGEHLHRPVRRLLRGLPRRWHLRRGDRLHRGRHRVWQATGERTAELILIFQDIEGGLDPTKPAAFVAGTATFRLSIELDESGNAIVSTGPSRDPVARRDGDGRVHVRGNGQSRDGWMDHAHTGRDADELAIGRRDTCRGTGAPDDAAPPKPFPALKNRDGGVLRRSAPRRRGVVSRRWAAGRLAAPRGERE